MTTYYQQLSEYNRYAQTMQRCKTAGQQPSLDPIHLTGRDDNWTNATSIQQLYLASDPKTRKSIDNWRHQSGGQINAVNLLMIAGTSGEPNRNLWGMIASNAVDEWAGKRTGLFSAPGMQNIRSSALNALRDMDATLGGWFGLRAGYYMLPDSWYRGPLADAIREGILTKDSADPAQGSFRHKPKAYTPDIMHYTAPAMALGAPVALGGILAGKPLLGLTGAAVIGAAGAGYGAARQNGWKGWEPINSAADSFNGLFSSKTPETPKKEKAEPKDPASKPDANKQN